MTFSIIVLAILLILAFYGVTIYNRLISLKNLVEEAWSGIDVQLKKRYNLIPNLVETVQSYTDHESKTFKEVTAARTQAQKAGSVNEQQAAENNLNKTLMDLFAVAEEYPELKSSTNYLSLQEELAEIEEDIEKSRRYYNGTVRDKNTLIESFPSNIIAGIMNFSKSEFFELTRLEERDVPEVNFD